MKPHAMSFARTQRPTGRLKERRGLVVKNLGMQKGAKQKQIEIAKKMLENKMDIDTIIELTGLAREEIEKLLN